MIVAATVTNGPPFARREVETVAAQFHPRRTRVLHDPDSRSLLASSSRGRIVHISTHGAFRGDICIRTCRSSIFYSFRNALADSRQTKHIKDDIEQPIIADMLACFLTVKSDDFIFVRNS